MRVFGCPAFVRLFDNADGVLPPSGEVVVVAPVVQDEKPAGRCVCEGCGCSLDTAGKIIRRGDGLKKYLGLEDTIKDLQKSLDIAQEENRELASQIAQLTAPKKRSIFM